MPGIPRFGPGRIKPKSPLSKPPPGGAQPGGGAESLPPPPTGTQPPTGVTKAPIGTGGPVALGGGPRGGFAGRGGPGGGGAGRPSPGTGASLASGGGGTMQRLLQSGDPQAPSGISSEIQPGGIPGTQPTPPVPPVPQVQPGTPIAGDSSVLDRFGYEGDIALDPLQQQGMDYISNLLAGGTPGEQLAPAQSLYEQILGGEFAPEGERFRGDVYKATEAGAMENLEKQQMMLAENFAQRGGYFGGKHGVAQAELGRGVSSDLSQLLGGLNLQGFQSDVANRMGAAQGMGGLAGTQRGMESSLLGDVMGAGGVGSQQDLINQQIKQGASDRAYQDWVRARGEQMMPFDMMQGLLGMQPTQTIAQQPQPSPFSALLGGVGQGAAAAGTAAALSSKRFKKDISEVTEEDENEIFEKMKGTHLFSYRYKNEPKDTTKHIGLITEESPEELTLFDKKAVGLYEYISMLHATVKVMNRKIERLEKKENGKSFMNRRIKCRVVQ